MRLWGAFWIDAALCLSLTATLGCNAKTSTAPLEEMADTDSGGAGGTGAGGGGGTSGAVTSATAGGGASATGDAPTSTSSGQSSTSTQGSGGAGGDVGTSSVDTTGGGSDTQGSTNTSDSTATGTESSTTTADTASVTATSSTGDSTATTTTTEGTATTTTGGTTGGSSLPEAPPITLGLGSCTPPCGLEFQNNPDYVGGTEGATLFYNFDTGEATLRNDPENASASDVVVLIFTWEDDYGFSVWGRTTLAWTFVENFEYVEDTNSLMTNQLMRAQMTNSQTGQTVLVSFSLTDEHEVLIYEVRLPTCDPAGGGVCQNASDCPYVDAGDSELVSSACFDCYAAMTDCSEANCAAQCASMTGNGCILCERDANCHVDFMACSGHDYMPPNTLTLP